MQHSELGQGCWACERCLRNNQTRLTCQLFTLRIIAACLITGRAGLVCHSLLALARPRHAIGLQQSEALAITFAFRASTCHSSVSKGAAEIHMFYTLQLFACGNEVTGLSLPSGVLRCTLMRVQRRRLCTDGDLWLPHL